MKDWSLVGIVLGTVIILGLGICEQAYLEDLAENIKNEVGEVEELVFSGQVEEGINKLQDVIKKWEKAEKVLSIMINHQDIHKVSDVLIEINSKLKDFSDNDNVSANFALLKEYIVYIEEANDFTTNNIL